MHTLRPLSQRIKAGRLGRVRDPYNHCHFHCAPEFNTPVLAHMLDSLVRVSRRGKENHFINAQSKDTLILYQLIKPDHCSHSTYTTSHVGNVTHVTLVSFASLSAISGTL
jgi:hypothetical protein